MILRLAALLAAGVCAGWALHLSGAVGAATPDAPSVSAFAGLDVERLRDIVGRAPAPAEVEAAPGSDQGGSQDGPLPLVAVDPFTPTRIEVRAAGVQAPVDALGLDSNGELEVPSDGARAGWWSGGSMTGQQGPTVVVGHVNSNGGEAGVFHSLAGLQPGDRARLISDDGRFTEYVVTKVETATKNRFPTDAVYGPTPGSELRLITCSGPFNLLRRSYRDNVIVYAALVDAAG